MILIINGHPGRKSLNHALAEQYRDGVLSAGVTAKILHLSDLKFAPYMENSFRDVSSLEADLLIAQDLIKQCRHLVFFYPLWWGSGPALLKAFVDRIFLPGFAFKYRENSTVWDKLLAGRSADIWLTADAPKIYIALAYWNCPTRWLSKATLEFSGFKPVKVHTIDRVRFRKPEQIQKKLESVKVAGYRVAHRLNHHH